MALWLFTTPVLLAQYTAADYLDWTKKHLDNGNCDDAEETYALYKEKVPSGNTDVERRIAECRKVPQKTIPHGYVDLGLPSGTLWKKEKEEGYYNYDEAVRIFSDRLPTDHQLMELKRYCRWVWNGRGYKVIGPNEEFIYFPALGQCWRSKGLGNVKNENSDGFYWSSTPCSSSFAWVLYFNSNNVNVQLGNRCSDRCYHYSVRLIYK
jgi:hypothetical protein